MKGLILPLLLLVLLSAAEAQNTGKPQPKPAANAGAPERSREDDLAIQKKDQLIRSLHGSWYFWRCRAWDKEASDFVEGCRQDQLGTWKTGKDSFGVMIAQWPLTKGLEMTFPPGDTMIVIEADQKYLKRIVGTPDGPSLSDIKWSCEWTNGDPTPAYFSNQTMEKDKTRFIISCDHMNDKNRHDYFMAIRNNAGPPPERGLPPAATASTK